MLMKRMNWVVVPVLLLSCYGLALAEDEVPVNRTIAEVLNQQIKNVETELIPAAEVMTDYSFAPTNGAFKDVRNFGQQLKHVAAVNYWFGSVILGEKPPVPTGDENGPDSIKSKMEILKFLNDSFAYAHKAAGSVNEKNLLEPLPSPFGEGKVTRLGMATMIVGHCFNHYGQIVEYLRMNNIIPPASRK
jgi:uncharacterized damage-inducible protein DinB